MSVYKHAKCSLKYFNIMLYDTYPKQTISQRTKTLHRTKLVKTEVLPYVLQNNLEADLTW